MRERERKQVRETGPGRVVSTMTVPDGGDEDGERVIPVTLSNRWLENNLLLLRGGEKKASGAGEQS